MVKKKLKLGHEEGGSGSGAGWRSEICVGMNGTRQIDLSIRPQDTDGSNVQRILEKPEHGVNQGQQRHKAQGKGLKSH